MQTYWSILMDGVIVNGQRAEVNLVAAIDTGTTLIYLPELVTSAFYNLVSNVPHFATLLLSVVSRSQGPNPALSTDPVSPAFNIPTRK